MITKVWRHLKNGTLRTRIREKLVSQRRKRRIEKWDTGNVSDQPLMVRLRPSVKLKLYRDSVLSRLIFVDNFEADELDFVERYLRPGDTFLDVGANIGLFTVIAARRVGPTGHVYSFEPSAKAFLRLEENIALNKYHNVKAFHMGVSSKVGQLQLVSARDGHDAWNSFAQPYIGSAMTTESVKCVSLDSFVEERGLGNKISLIKIDVEGWESHVLSGGIGTLGGANGPAILIEFTEEAACSAGTTCQDLYRQLTDLGYKMHLYDSREKRLISDPMRQQYTWINLVALKPSHSFRESLI